MFQSHNGAIAASRPIRSAHHGTCAFQSHNGAIAAGSEKLVKLLQCCFNPTMVRLLPVTKTDGVTTLDQVSIPQWCDCCSPALLRR